MGAELEPDVIGYNAGISACEKGGQWQQALSLLREVWNIKLKPEFTSFAIAISMCEQDGQRKQAQSLLRELLEAAL